MMKRNGIVCFWGLSKLSMQQSLAYRAGFLINLALPFLLLFGQFFLWKSLFNENDSDYLVGFSRSQLYCYLLLVFFLNNLMTWKSENTTSRKIIEGSIVTDCVRPVSFLLQNMANMFGSILLQTVVNFILVFGLFFMLQSVIFIGEFITTILFFVSLLLGLMLRMLFIHTFSLLCFYTTSHLGLAWTRVAITDFFSGAIIPLTMFPIGLKFVSYCTPFPYFVHAPISIYLTLDPFLPIWGLFLVPLVWIIFFIVLQKALWRRMQKNMTIAGG